MKPTIKSNLHSFPVGKLLIVLLSVFLVAFFASKPQTIQAAPATQKLRIGVSPVPHAEIVQHVVAELAKQGIQVEIVNFEDYVQPNLALAHGELDANYFQHIPYLTQFNKDHGTKIVSVAKVHIEPIGLYPGRVKSLAGLPHKALIAIPNDPVNGGRALLLLQSAGLLKLKPTASGTLATVRDIADNPRHLQFRELEAAQLPRVLQDVSAAVINTNYALEAGLNPVKNAIFIENSDSPYANVVAVNAGHEKDPRVVALVKALNSPDTRKFILEKYKGAIVPAF
jgi:D-methionine transport system substrate-binding protein